jgi:hypothetical protein
LQRAVEKNGKQLVFLGPWRLPNAAIEARCNTHPGFRQLKQVPGFAVGPRFPGQCECFVGALAAFQGNFTRSHVRNARSWILSRGFCTPITAPGLIGSSRFRTHKYIALRHIRPPFRNAER